MVAAVVVLAGCAPSGCDTEADRLKGLCIDAYPPVSQAIGADVYGAAEAPTDSKGRERFYYSTPTGATWISGITPDGEHDGSPTLPLNSRARKESSLGRRVPPDARGFDGVSNHDDGARASRICA